MPNGWFGWTPKAQWYLSGLRLNFSVLSNKIQRCPLAQCCLQNHLTNGTSVPATLAYKACCVTAQPKYHWFTSCSCHLNSKAEILKAAWKGFSGPIPSGCENPLGGAENLCFCLHYLFNIVSTQNRVLCNYTQREPCILPGPIWPELCLQFYGCEKGSLTLFNSLVQVHLSEWEWARDSAQFAKIEHNLYPCCSAWYSVGGGATMYHCAALLHLCGSITWAVLS